MAHPILLQRIREAVDRDDYLVPVGDDALRAPLTEVATILRDPAGDASEARRRVYAMQADGRLDPITALSALSVIAASPRVRDYAEAARLASQQEFAALEHGGPHQARWLAAADRHRGVIAYLMGRYEVALDWFTRSLERERSAENLGNVLCALVRLDDHEGAQELLDTIRTALPLPLRQQVEERILVDGDLRPLRGATALVI